jgi:hypothetical protein
MLFPTYGVPTPAAPLEALSRDLFELDFSAVEWSADTGEIIAASGHVGTFTRGATLASVADSLGTTYTALEAQPAYEARDWDNDGIREAFGLRMGTADRLAFPAAFRLQHCGLLEIIETGARTTAGATLFAYRNDGATGAGVWLDTSGSFYRLNYNDGTTTRTATLSSGSPASGDRVRFTWELSSAGALTFNQSINGAAATTATAAALTLPANAPASASVRLNTQGSTANPAQGWYRRARLVPGAFDLAALTARR